MDDDEAMDETMNVVTIAGEAAGIDIEPTIEQGGVVVLSKTSRFLFLFDNFLFEIIRSKTNCFLFVLFVNFLFEIH